MPTRKNDPRHKALRREKAAERITAREALGDAGQLAKLEKQGFGSGKEAQRLRKKLHAS